MENRVTDAMKYRYEKNEAYLRAQKKVKKILGFYKHLATYVIINLFVIGIILYAQDDWSNVWQSGVFSMPLFWGIGLFFHAMGVWGPDLIFGKNWEKRKIKAYMEKYKNDGEYE